ncbi:unnamed protein product [Adineta steineri]|uniref:Uncharacterized protein n=1 Tax=Adineta steineri TaxID=433720 RepID=A0A814L9Y2_9BILA|nr:unnamed protein product [Adineta steineri]CAF1200224.1 unnamed protein product [Adineta steineri]CAF3893837.1 unnamed protein product [Adineta steineri]CAF4109986.1 unnamed protein product [Adineta steineri]
MSNNNKRSSSKSPDKNNRRSIILSNDGIKQNSEIGNPYTSTQIDDVHQNKNQSNDNDHSATPNDSTNLDKKNRRGKGKKQEDAPDEDEQLVKPPHQQKSTVDPYEPKPPYELQSTQGRYERQPSYKPKPAEDEDGPKPPYEPQSTQGPYERKSPYKPKATEDQDESKSSTISQQPSKYSKNQRIIGFVVAITLCYIFGPSLRSFFDDNRSPSKGHTYDKDWRSKVDPNDVLSNHQQNIIRASLKPILDKSSSEEGVSSLLILSNDEENAAKIARCLLKLVNTDNDKATISTEIDLRSHHGGKIQLDSKLRSLLGPGGTIRAVLLRQIDDNSSDDAIEQARLLFAYCDGENPVIPHRLIIMTATDNSEKELREKFKTRWPTEHDFVDALFSRISGHTFFVDNDQKSIC